MDPAPESQQVGRGQGERERTHTRAVRVAFSVWGKGAGGVGGEVGGGEGKGGED